MERLLTMDKGTGKREGQENGTAFDPPGETRAENGSGAEKGGVGSHCGRAAPPTSPGLLPKPSWPRSPISPTPPPPIPTSPPLRACIKNHISPPNPPPPSNTPQKAACPPLPLLFRATERGPKSSGPPPAPHLTLTPYPSPPRARPPPRKKSHFSAKMPPPASNTLWRADRPPLLLLFGGDVL